jgi:hypothetical protein
MHVPYWAMTYIVWIASFCYGMVAVCPAVM